MTRTPRLRPDVAIVEQTYRGQQSFVVKDLETHKYFRFGPLEVTVMRTFDGAHTCHEAAAALRGAGINVSEAVVEGFAQKLNRMGLMERSLTERSTMQVERLRAERQRRTRPRLFRGEVMRMRWSLGDPNAAFDRWVPRIRFLFTRRFLILSIGLFVTNIILLTTNWPKLHAGFAQLTDVGSYTVAHAVLFWLTLLVIIMVHELGHGATCKYFGGEVHEMGFMMLYFQPAFYADVNDAWTFPDLRSRLWVTAAGLWIEGVVTTLAGIVWWIAEPGTLVSQVALLAFLFGGVFSVLTNANPLMPLDGYFALSDYLEIPNLRHRAFGHVDWLIRRYVLRLEMPMPPASERERRVFLIYGVAAIAYLTMVLALVGSLVLRRANRAFGVAGVIVALVGIALLLRGPIRGWMTAIRHSMHEHRAALTARRFRLTAGGIILAVVLLLALVPWSITVSAPFQTAAARATPLVAPDSGYIAAVLVREGTSVAAGAPLVRLRDFDLDRAALQQQRTVDSIGLLVRRARAGGDAGGGEQLSRAESVAAIELAALNERIARLVLRARHAGVVLTARPERLAGRWVNAGETVLTLGEPDSVEARIRLSGSGATLVKPGQPVRLLSLADAGHPLRARVTSVARTATGGAVEARVRLVTAPAWRAGASGEASIIVRRSNVAGALWTALRRRIRSDILL